MKIFKLESCKLNLVGICLLSFIVSSFAAETNRTSGAVPWRFHAIAKETDAVVIGRLLPIKGTFLNPYHHIDFYKIDVDEIVAGNSSRVILAVYDNHYTSFGKMVNLQPKMQYMFFLRECDESFEWLSKEGTVYQTVRYYQGVVSLDPKAEESRSVIKIKEQYGIDVHKSKDSFVEAVKATVKFEIEEVSTDADSKQLSAEANKIFSVLGLKEGSLIEKGQEKGSGKGVRKRGQSFDL